MKTKNDRIEMLKMLISSNELGSQEEVLNALAREGFKVTQATLSRAECAQIFLNLYTIGTEG